MLQLSIIIVNYNVRYFLEQCLFSVQKALSSKTSGLPLSGSPDSPAAEIIVVDNHSSDDSVNFLRTRFPRVEFLMNQENIGFAKANNQALAMAKGKYILFLNPDTILAEDSLQYMIAYLASNPGAGAVGVRMVDGRGHFLKESMRGFPTPWVAFCKLSGLTTLFPHAKLFAGYYLGYLSPAEDHPAPVLSGACMLVRKETLDRTGGFDERFFMYAEDIDLSYRIGQAGYTTHYLAGTTILHFKGESTVKDRRYRQLFYKAMSQFNRKHFRAFRILHFLTDAALWVTVRLGSHSAPGEDPPRIPPPQQLWITGDPLRSARVAQILSTKGRIIVGSPEQADMTVLCEGPAFSFAACIAALDSRSGYTIHAAGSSAAVGSPSGTERGAVITL